MPQPLYFDITDIVRYAQVNERVSGIQRVQFNLIAHLVAIHGGSAIRCVLFHPLRKRMVELDPQPLFSSEGFDASALLQRLGVEAGRGWFPSRHSIKKYLHRYSRSKATRAWKKADVYASALFMPRRLARMGLSRGGSRHEPLVLSAVDQLPPSCAYVILSANVSLQPVFAFAQRHVERGGKVFQLVYDLISHVHPEYFTPSMVKDFQEWLAVVRRLRPGVICISEWTARDFKNWLGAEATGWDVHTIGLSHEFDGRRRGDDVVVPPAMMQGLPERPYVLCVGTLEIRKNGTALLDAWEALAREFGDALPSLVFAGKRGWLIDGFMERLDASPELRRRVQIITSPADDQVAWLYRHCEFTVFPSHYEGWGLPVGESAWFGKYCIASNTSSIPEVCGALIDYFDPADPSDIQQKLRRALREPEHVRERERQIAAAPLRSWRDVAEDIHRVATANGTACGHPSGQPSGQPNAQPSGRSTSTAEG